MGVSQEVSALAEPVAARRGLVLVDAAMHVASGRSVLRVVVDRPDGVTLADAEGFHRELEALLDAAPALPGAYALEVSSPGAERPLRTERDFRLFVGRAVLLAARAPVDGRREWAGWLVGLEDGQVVVRLGDGGQVRLPLPAVAWARLRLP